MISKVIRAKVVRLPDTTIKQNKSVPGKNRWQLIWLLLILLSIWSLAPFALHKIDQTAAGIDQTIWLLIILSLIAFLLVTALCWWLLERFWLMAGLPQFSTLVSQFYTLSPWQQLVFYLSSFALLLVAASVCLAGIC